MSHHNAARACVDFDIHGRVGLRVFGASVKQARAIGSQVGVVPSSLGRTPDLVVRFADPSDLQKLDFPAIVGDACFAPDGKVGWRNARTKCLESVWSLAGTWQPMEVLCDRRCRRLPLLEPLLHLFAIANGVVPLHASAFLHDGQAAAVVGWAGSGKTGILLAMLDAGAEFISDDRVYIDAETGDVQGFRLPVALRQSYLKQMPTWNKHVPIRKRLAVLTTVVAQRSLQKGRAASCLSTIGLHRGARLVERFCASEPKVLLAPHELSQMAPVADSARLNKVLFSLPWDRRETELHRISTDDAVESIVQSTRAELAPLEHCYSRMRFAYPGLFNAELDQCWASLRALARQIVEGKDVYVIRHSRCVSLEAMKRELTTLFLQHGKDEPAVADGTAESTNPELLRGKAHAISSYA